MKKVWAIAMLLLMPFIVGCNSIEWFPKDTVRTKKPCRLVKRKRAKPTDPVIFDVVFRTPIKHLPPTTLRNARDYYIYAYTQGKRLSDTWKSVRTFKFLGGTWVVSGKAKPDLKDFEFFLEVTW
jgi:hypothetical protein